ncbi:plasmid replication/partition related protein [Hydrogenophaga sp. A37]|uniref:plasmid replication/partition related protein n=1 Tax=Hydrogenophaga sp. A37 TaxID=1945864 RepID=UPI000984C58B|nr:plasmid replication/partition related protein [Hydrogenophaga sp. A37]OOG87676.1 plasmid replication/partition related protein [Hydrogenophaga sp. A37]
MNITVNADLKAYIDPLTPDEHDALERSLLAEGCRDALVLWGDVLVDGHNRYGICQKHGLPFQTVQNPRFQSMEDVHLWMIDQHLGRRSVSDFQRGVLALRRREIEAERRGRASAAAPASSLAESEDVTGSGGSAAVEAPAPKPLKTREDIARAARLSSGQVVMIEKIQKQAAPELVEALKAGAISLNAAAVVASLPAEEQKAAALAGKDELKLVVKRVRESRRKPEENPEAAADAAPVQAEGGEPDDALQALRRRVAELEAENASLREQLQALSAQLVD